VTDEVIERKDEYYLSKQDWDAVVELGVDEHIVSAPCCLISGLLTQLFIFRYNASEHPILFHKWVKHLLPAPYSMSRRRLIWASLDCYLMLIQSLMRSLVM